LRLGWVAVGGFLLLAISPVVTFGAAVLLDLLPWTPSSLAVFRSSGRFAWLAMYVVFTGVLAVVVAALPRRAAVAVVAAALALQTWDLSAAYGRVRARAGDPAWTDWQSPLRSPAWSLAAARYPHLVMVPPDMCAAVWSEPAGPHLPFSLLAGLHGATINSGNAGRYDVAGVLHACAALRADVEAGRVEDGNLYVLSPALRAQLAATTHTPLACGTLDGFDVCVTEASFAAWRDDARRAGFLAASVLPPGR
jgi:hypothetical protein